MALEEKKAGNFLTITGGSIRKTVPQGTSGAIIREYETSDGKRGTKYELVYSRLSGIIKSVRFRDSDYGKQIAITIEDEGVDYTLSMVTDSPYAEDLMKKLPSVDFKKRVSLEPFDFENNRGKRSRGITLMQNKEKIKNFFYDEEKKQVINGFPTPEGDTKDYDKEDWKIYFMKVRKFLVGYTTENIYPQFENRIVDEYPQEEITPDDIPF